MAQLPKRVPGALPGTVPGTVVEVVRWTNPAGGGECTIVWLPTDRLDPQVANTEITAIERERAAGYHRDSDRLLSLGSAWLMRQVVAPLLGVAPLEVPITRHCPACVRPHARPHGRPIVSATTRQGAKIEVSATHSNGLVGVALSTSGAIGIDVENLQARGPAAWPTVWRALGRDDLDHAPGAARTAARTWVRTEAVLKATGCGPGVTPRSVHVTSGDAPRVTRWPWGDPGGRVSLFDLSPAAPFVGALAVVHPGPRWSP